MSPRNRIIFLYIGAFLMPPLAWLGLGWYGDIWNLRELLAIISAPFIWIYVFAYVSLATFLLLWILKTSDNWLKDQNPDGLKKVLKSLRNLPMLFSVNIMLYILIGPKIVLYGQTFLTSTEFWLAEATGLPIIFLFAAPFFIGYLKAIEEYSHEIPLSPDIPFMSLRMKMLLTLGYTTLGVIILFGLFNISVVNADKAKTGEELFKVILEKDTVAALISIAIISINVLMVISSVSKPISKVEAGLNDMLRNIDQGEADLSFDIRVDSRDEIGSFTRKLNEMVLSLRKLINIIKANAYHLSHASQDLTKVSAQVTSGSEKSATDAGQVASSSEQLSVNMNTMASTTEEMSVNISSVASAADQISQNMNSITKTVDSLASSMDSILQNSKASTQVSSTAKDMAQNATYRMSSLGEAANEIGEVTTVIKGIAEKTNLLALNATIEAASAGDAGKGFAVVAIEIKELANQSAKAAEDIARRITEVQNSTSEAVKAINDVAEIINQINHSTSTINSSVTEQTKAMENISININETNRGIHNIAKSVQELTLGSGDLSRNAGEAAKGTETIASNILTVNSSIAENYDSAKKVDRAARQLLNISEELSSQVSKFIVKSQVNMKELSTLFEEMIADHVARGKSVDRMLDGGPLAEPIKESECALGQWLMHEGVQNWGQLEEFRSILPVHEKIHSLLYDIRTAYDAGKYDTAHEMNTEWKRTSDELKSKLYDLRQFIQNSQKI